MNHQEQEQEANNQPNHMVKKQKKYTTPELQCFGNSKSVKRPLPRFVLGRYVAVELVVVATAAVISKSRPMVPSSSAKDMFSSQFCFLFTQVLGVKALLLHLSLLIMIFLPPSGATITYTHTHSQPQQCLSSRSSGQHRQTAHLSGRDNPDRV